MSKTLYDDCVLNYFDFSSGSQYPSLRSLIIAATPSPPVNIKFTIRGTSFPVQIPPHYSDRKAVNANIRNITTQLFDKNGFQTIPVVLPKKLLAVHCGLATFGKNNLCYVPGMGSYHRLTVFGSDLPVAEENWLELKMLERCKRCKACIKCCPTGAIGNDRFVIKADRCLTNFNERLDPLPGWIDNRWHNSLIGCMKCQSVCPENKKSGTGSECSEEFSDTETELILQGTAFQQLPTDLQTRIKNLCMDKYYRQLQRNLALLIKMSFN